MLMKQHLTTVINDPSKLKQIKIMLHRYRYVMMYWHTSVIRCANLERNLLNEMVVGRCVASKFDPTALSANERRSDQEVSF